MASISIDSLADEISSLMEEYAADVNSDMKAEAKEIAKEAVKELKQTSPEGKGSKKGHYKNGWASKVVAEKINSLDIVIYNRKKPGLTHLLEKGHAKRGGGRVEGKPHIGPAEQKAIRDYEKGLKARLSR
ncbi:hypothetical protein K413DRAFT_1229 [Clostridium sp. ASBs410]|nr:hypothetical protein K413DRAFT_1229 [Clostridium sp. ASBs410]